MLSQPEAAEARQNFMNDACILLKYRWMEGAEIFALMTRDEQESLYEQLPFIGLFTYTKEGKTVEKDEKDRGMFMLRFPSYELVRCFLSLSNNQVRRKHTRKHAHTRAHMGRARTHTHTRAHTHTHTPTHT